jgi:hypothetical protein
MLPRLGQVTPARSGYPAWLFVFFFHLKKQTKQNKINKKQNKTKQNKTKQIKQNKKTKKNYGTVYYCPND